MICKTCKKELPDGEFYLYTRGERMLMRKDCKACYRISRNSKRNPAPKKEKKREELPIIFNLQILWKKIVQRDLR